MSSPPGLDHFTTCPSCGESAPPGAHFCEACGAPLAPSANPPGTAAPTALAGERLADADGAPCGGCGAPADVADADGYCTRCGLRRPDSREHEERVVDGGLVGITDRGLRHHRNEDAQALARTPAGDAVLVVCDGVSTTQHPEDASQAAADAACAVLREWLAGCQDGQTADDGGAAATRRAVAAAQEAVMTISFDPALVAKALGPPSCTIVTAVIRGGAATVGWLGDSRAYRVRADGEVIRLTEDHSWAVEQVAQGTMSEPDAQSDPRAHVITRWLGADAPELDALMVKVDLDPDDRVLLCSDGLWNYAETPEALAALIADRAPAASAAELARSLVAYARECGGHDNITVVVCDPVASGSPPASSTPRPDDHAMSIEEAPIRRTTHSEEPCPPSPPRSSRTSTSQESRERSTPS